MNRKPFIALMFFILIISIMMFGIGCAEDAVFPGNEAEKQPERITSNIVSIPIERVRTLNPLLSLYFNSYQFSPVFNSTESGTFSSMAFSIFSFKMVFTLSNSSR
jgi:hypothetical protein